MELNKGERYIMDENTGIGLSFPINDGGTTQGDYHADTEHFRGEKENALGKEIPQNSCDAKRDDCKEPVRVAFKLNYLKREEFPGYKEYVSKLELCDKAVESLHDGNERIKKFIKNFKEVFERDEIPFLVVSDYNTTGLIGAENRNGGMFCRLTKGAGNSNKGGQSGGSYGIGKGAAFACSSIKTVFYSSKDINGVKAFQGVSKWVSHYDENEEATQGTGYYGAIKNKMPIIGDDGVGEFFRRNEVGTSIFIAGFDGDDDWEENMIKAILDSFFLAIVEGKLIVEVEDTIIDDKSIKNIIDKIKEKNKNWITAEYYEALISRESKRSIKSFGDKGEIELILLKGHKFSRRVALVRGTGMKIKDKDRIRVPIKFTGVMIVRGQNIDSFLRKLEPPAHDDWKKKLYEEDPKYAEKMLNNIYKWINDSVKQLVKVYGNEELDIEGADEYLPDCGKNVKELEKEIAIKKIGIKTGKVDKSKKQKKLKGSKEPKEPKEPTEPKEPMEHKPGDDMKMKEIEFEYTRIFCIDEKKGQYKAIMKANKTGKTFLKFNIEGEVESYAAMIQSVESNKNEEINVIKDGRVGPVMFKAGEKKIILITLDKPMTCALEVISVES